eukprot:6001592-Pyramimonas_sp.AAC.1
MAPAAPHVINVPEETQEASATALDDDTEPQDSPDRGSGAAAAAADEWEMLSARGGSPKRTLPAEMTTPRISRLRSSFDLEGGDGSPPDGRQVDDASSSFQGDDEMSSPGLLGQMGEDGGRRTQG